VYTDGTYYTSQFDAFNLETLPALVIMKISADSNLFAKMEGEELYSQASLERFAFDVIHGNAELHEASIAWSRWVYRIFMGFFSWNFISSNPLLILFVFFGLVVLFLMCSFDFMNAAVGDDEEEDPETVGEVENLIPGENKPKSD
jgi:hypothetical protein